MYRTRDETPVTFVSVLPTLVSNYNRLIKPEKLLQNDRGSALVFQSESISLLQLSISSLDLFHFLKLIRPLFFI